MQSKTAGPLPMHLIPRCGARTRNRTPCRSPAMPNGLGWRLTDSSPLLVGVHLLQKPANAAPPGIPRRQRCYPPTGPRPGAPPPDLPPASGRTPLPTGPGRCEGGLPPHPNPPPQGGRGFGSKLNGNRSKRGKGEVGAPGFEPGAFGSQSRRATRLRYAPLGLRKGGTEAWGSYHATPGRATPESWFRFKSRLPAHPSGRYLVKGTKPPCPLVRGIIYLTTHSPLW